MTLPELYNLPPAPAEASKEVAVEIDWRGCLNRALVKQSATSIDCDRMWAQLCEELRAHCPETQWYFVNPCNSAVKPSLNSHFFERWVRHLVAHVSWPFPKYVLIKKGSISDKFDWFLSIPGDCNFSPETFGLPLNVVPLKHPGYSGFAIKLNDPTRTRK